MKKIVLVMTALASILVAPSVVTAETYHVQKGDTLSKIAEEKNTTVEKLVALNKLTDPNFIILNQPLEIPQEKSETQTSLAQTENSEQKPEPVAVQVASQTTVYNPTPSQETSVILANGNTAGEQGAYAAAKMAEMTGVPASTWEHIIARESNGQVDATNGSGASGLFQTMPGWGSTATVDDQIQAAYNAYAAQGMSAWGY